MPETVSEKDETTPRRLSRHEPLRQLLNIVFALAIAMVEAELLLVSRFLRDVIQGRDFWHYLALLQFTIGVVLGFSTNNTRSKTDSLLRSAVKGILSGLIGSFVGIVGTLLLTKVIYLQHFMFTAGRCT